MQEIFLGEYIKNRRLELGLTQEQLCEGICEPITLSRLENGKQTPSRNRINALLQRLGLPDDRYFALLSQNEMDISNLQEEILADSIRFKRASNKDRPAIRAAGLQKLEQLEKLIDKDDRITQQYILSCRATFGRPEGPYTPEERLDMLMAALRLTVPRIDLEEINLGWYSMEETKLINQIAISYDMMGNRKKAIDIYRQLLKYVQKHYKELNRYAGQVTLIAQNYARELVMEERYAEAAEVAELGRGVCVEYGHYQFLPGLLDLLGGCYFYTGDIDRCRALYCQAYYIYAAINNEHDRAILKKEMKERLNMELPY